MVRRSSITTNKTKKYLNCLVGNVSYNISESGLRFGVEVDTRTKIYDENISNYLQFLANVDNNYLNTTKILNLEPRDNIFYKDIYSQANIEAFINSLNPLL